MTHSRVLVALACAACGATPAPQQTAAAAASRCHYDVSLTSAGSGVVTVRASCDGNQVRRFVASERTMAHHVRARTLSGEEIARREASFELPVGEGGGLTYRVDLAVVARERADIDIAYQAGTETWIAPASTWLLRPHPVPPELLATLRVRTAPGYSFASGLRRHGDAYQLRAHQMRDATYGVFGRFDRRVHLISTPSGASNVAATVEVITASGVLEGRGQLLNDWVRASALAVADFWRGFPVARVVVVLVPAGGRNDVSYGKLVAAGGATVVVFVGEEARADDLRSDWVMVHELLHLGFPSFGGEGKWLAEGLATYYEPIIRARAGWLTPRQVWGELASELHHGRDAVERLGVEHARDTMSRYWGGALFALLADVRARRLSGGRLGLEDGLRAVVSHGGNASKLWSMERVVAVIDQRLGAPIMAELLAAHRYAGSPVDLEGLLRELGVRHSGAAVKLDDDAPLAAVRRAILLAPAR